MFKLNKKYLIKRNIIILLIVVFLTAGILIYHFIKNSDPECSVYEIKLYGTLVTYKLPDSTEDQTSSEDILDEIQYANENKDIKVIVIEVDSTGGSIVAGEEISNAIKNSEKPVVAYIRDVGASSSYWAISSADKIYASRNSEIGSIGVTASYLNEVEKNKQEGYEYERLVSGKFKDTGAVARKLTNEEKAYIMEDLNYNFSNFKEDVSINRNIPIEEVDKMATGATFTGKKSLELGLIDEIGDMYDIGSYLESEFGESLYVCGE